MRFLKELREKMEISQMQLSKISGVSQPVISDIERGKTSSPRFYTITKLASALGCTADELLALADDEEQDQITKGA